MARARANLPLAERGASLRKKAITVAASVRFCQSSDSALRRKATMFGQLGLAAMKAEYRAMSTSVSSARRISHSTTLRATGSEIEFSALVASSVRPRCARSKACFTAAMSNGDVDELAAIANAGEGFKEGFGAGRAGIWFGEALTRIGTFGFVPVVAGPCPAEFNGSGAAPFFAVDFWSGLESAAFLSAGFFSAAFLSFVFFSDALWS